MQKNEISVVKDATDQNNRRTEEEGSESLALTKAMFYSVYTYFFLYNNVCQSTCAGR